jgi:demethoxyubiquinone hydroxylase (CLK1/Coq7/Cat5 family)
LSETPSPPVEPSAAEPAAASPELVVAAAPLVRDMRQSLRSELGAFSLYSLLPRVTRDAEVRRLLAELRRDETEIIARVSQLTTELGGTPEHSRWTRSLVAWGLVIATPVIGVRFSLRLCCEAASTVSRWYAEYAAFCYSLGDRDRVQRFSDLSMTKRIHATRLRTFVDNLPMRGGQD